MNKVRYYAVYLLLSVLAWIFVRYVFAIDGLYGQDSYEYLRFSTAINAGWESGHWPSGFFWPIIYPLFGAVFTLITTDSAFSLQIISVLSLAGTLIYLHRILVSITRNERVIQIYLIAGVFLSPLVFRSSFLCMSDMLCAFLLTALVYYAMQFRNERGVKVLFLATLMGGLAVFTRYASAPILMVVAVWVAIGVFKQFRLSYLIVIIVAIALVLVPHFAYTNAGILHFAKHPWLTEWSFQNFFRSSFVTNDGHTTYPHVNLVFNLIEIVHPRFFILIVPLMVFAILNKVRSRNAVVFTSALIYFVFLCGMPCLNTRFLLQLLPLVSILCFPSFVLIAERIHYRKILAVLIFALGFGLSIAGFGSIYERVRLEKDIVSYLGTNYAHRTIYSFDLDGVLRGRKYDGTVLSMYDSVYPVFKRGELFLFNPNRFGQQWSGRSPMLNWNNLLKNYNVDTAEYYNQGWRLYEVK